MGVPNFSLRLMENLSKRKSASMGAMHQKKAQAHGKKAQQFAHDLVHGEMVTIIEHGQDKYKRIIGKCY